MPTKEEEAFSSSPKQVMHLTNTLEHAQIFLKGMVNEQGCLSRRHDVSCHDGPLRHDTIGST